MSRRGTKRKGEEETNTGLTQLLTQVAAGELPKSDAMTAALESAQRVLHEWAPASGKEPVSTIVQQLDNFLDGLKKLSEKHVDENLERIMSHGRQVAAQGRKRLTEVATGKEAKELRRGATELYAAIRELALQTISSSDFRSLLIDMFDLLQEAGAVAAEKVQEAAAGGILEEKESEESLEKAGEKRKGRGGKGGAKKAKSSAEKVLTMAPLTEDQRNRLRTRMHAIARKANENEALRRGVDASFRLARAVSSLAKKGKKKTAEFDTDELLAVWNETKSLIEKFTGGSKLDEWATQTWDFLSNSLQKEDFSQFLSDFGSFFTDAIKNPQLLEATSDRFNQLTDKARSIFGQVDFSAAYDKAVTGLKNFFNLIAKDPAMSLMNNARSLVSSMFLDEKGQLSFKSETLTRMREIVLRIIIDQLKHLPIPKIEGANDTYEYCFEGMHLNVADMLPDQVLVRIENNLAIDVKAATTQEVLADVIIEANNIKTSIPDLKFWFKRSGLVSLEDQGKASVHLTGEGASIVIHLFMDPREYAASKTLFRVKDITCTIDAIKILIVESGHETLLNWLSPIISSRVKGMLEEQIEESLRNGLESAESGLTRLIEAVPSAEKLKDIAQAATEAVSGPLSQTVSTVTNAVSSIKG